MAAPEDANRRLHGHLSRLGERLDPCDSVVTAVGEALEDAPAASSAEGGHHTAGFLAGVGTSFGDVSRNGREYIANLEREEKGTHRNQSLKWATTGSSATT